MSNTGQRRKKRPSKKRRRAKVIIFSVEILVLLVVLAGLYVSLKLSKMDSGKEFKAKRFDGRDSGNPGEIYDTGAVRAG